MSGQCSIAGSNSDSAVSQAGALRDRLAELLPLAAYWMKDGSIVYVPEGSGETQP